MRSGIFFNHFGRTHELELFDSGFVGIVGCMVDNMYETFFEADPDAPVVDLICFAIDAWKDEYKIVEGIGWSQRDGQSPVVSGAEVAG